ncbi:hypothetical protein FA95DRAFT_1578718 [Auriscalpium vulgare]|uniref:Uncharacterized protein n=1 Tax=Auriscalpium vulgare TaxID=40419 RepID=A0ACB8R0K9_9AGAM|nr:hypothetical protein FA95DRAFT_1578718 [Auriscalpium vulgare]
MVQKGPSRAQTRRGAPDASHTTFPYAHAARRCPILDAEGSLQGPDASRWWDASRRLFLSLFAHIPSPYCALLTQAQQTELAMICRPNLRTTRTGRIYADIPSCRPLQTNLKYGQLLEKAVERDDQIAAAADLHRLLAQLHVGELDAYGEEHDPLETDAFYSPTDLSPVPSTPSTRPTSPCADVEEPSMGKTPSQSKKRRRRKAAAKRTGQEGGATTDAVEVDKRKKVAPQPSGAERASQGLTVPEEAARLVGSKTKASSKVAKRRRRQRARQEAAELKNPLTELHEPSFARRHAAPTVYKVNADAYEYAITKGAYTVRRLGSFQDEPWTASELDDMGFAEFPWNGLGVNGPMHAWQHNYS